ncbi:hypothetical protein [Methylorubrum populi]|uniref:hypothetical protein n=1 Tax=Methylorubrum populi TaxID=223967 RepID=UPI003F65C363
MSEPELIWLLSDKQWSAISALGTVAQAVTALVGLLFVGTQIRQARKTGDLQSLQDFLRAAKDHEHALINSGSDEDREKAFYEFVNFLEIQAAALRGGLFSSVTRRIVREKIRDSVAVIEDIEPWMAKLESAISSETTFEHLRRFCKRERRYIDRVKRARADVGSTSAAGPPSQ